jgi:hypothetical protein
MTNIDFNSNELESDTKPLFKSFEWHMKPVEDALIPGRHFADFAGKVRDVASGCETILHLIENHTTHESCDGRPLLSDYHIGNLMRLAISSLSDLNVEAAQSLDWAYDYHTPEGKAQRLASASK